MDKLIQINNNSKNKVIDRIIDLKNNGFKKIESRYKTKKNEILYTHEKKWYKIVETETIFDREPLKLDLLEYKYFLWNKEYIVFSPFGKLIEIYPKLRLAKEFINYCVKYNVDFLSDKLLKWTHYKV